MIFHGGFQKHVVALLATSKTTTSTGKILYGNPYRAATFVLKSKSPGKRRDALILNIIAYVVHGSGEVEVVVYGMFTGFEGYHSLPEVISFPKMYVI